MIFEISWKILLRWISGELENSVDYTGSSILSGTILYLILPVRVQLRQSSIIEIFLSQESSDHGLELKIRWWCQMC